jgi:hypothetical protein
MIARRLPSYAPALRAISKIGGSRPQRAHNVPAASVDAHTSPQRGQHGGVSRGIARQQNSHTDPERGRSSVASHATHKGAIKTRSPASTISRSTAACYCKCTAEASLAQQ